MKIPDIKKEVIGICVKEFFKINPDLEIGSEIEVEFSYDRLHTKYKSQKLERMVHRKNAKGILKNDEKGLFVESIDTFQFYKLDYSVRSGYKSEKRKAIKRISCGI